MKLLALTLTFFLFGVLCQVYLIHYSFGDKAKTYESCEISSYFSPVICNLSPGSDSISLTFLDHLLSFPVPLQYPNSGHHNFSCISTAAFQLIYLQFHDLIHPLLEAKVIFLNAILISSVLFLEFIHVFSMVSRTPHYHFIFMLNYFPPSNFHTLDAPEFFKFLDRS